MADNSRTIQDLNKIKKNFKRRIYDSINNILKSDINHSW